MSNLSYRQSKIQEKRKQTPRREFVMEICSWRPVNFYKIDCGISKYPNNSSRLLHLMNPQNHLEVFPNGSILENEVINNDFFANFQQLFYKIPHAALQWYGTNNENNTWADAVRGGGKNIYLTIIAGDNAENILYSFKTESNVRNVIDSLNITFNCESIICCKTVRNSRNIFYSNNIYDSSDVRFCSNLIGCQNCICCDNLQNTSYAINNVICTKDEFLKQKKVILEGKYLFETYREKNVGGNIILSESCSGESIFHCDQVKNGYEIAHITRGNNVLYSDGGNDSSDIYDCMDVASDTTHHLYGVYGQGFGDHIYCTLYLTDSSYIYYSYFLQNCSFCLGCIGLKNKSYCILNKQYSKEEWYQKVDEIFGQMEKDGTLGQFFPATMNPFYFNDTAAYLIDPSFTKEEVTAKGYLRRDEAIKVDIPEGMEIVKTSELGNYEGFDSEGNRTINTDILKKVIQDETGNVYRIIPMEYKFLVKHGLPLPRKHWLERMKENFRIS